MGRKSQVVLQIDEDIMGAFVKKIFGNIRNRDKAIAVLSLIVEDLLKEFILGKKHIKVKVLDKDDGVKTEEIRE